MEEKEVKKGNGGKIGAALGAAAGALGTVMSNPLGRWAIFNAQTDTALRIHNTVEDIFKSRGAGDLAYNIFCKVTDVIMAYPAILPIAGGLLAAGVGALVGKKISKCKLKHQNMKQKQTEKTL